MKKICYVTTVPSTLESFVVPVVSQMQTKVDWEFTMISNVDPEFEKLLPDGVRYIPIPMQRGVSLGGIKAMLRMVKVFRKEQFDLVQYSTPNAGLYAAIATWISGVEHRKYHLMGFRFLGFSGLKRHVFMWIEKLACYLSTDIECVSKSNLKLGIELGIFPKEKATVLHYGSSAGVDLTRFDIQRKGAWRRKLRTQFGYNDNDCVFGYVGRITRDKGINEMLAAFDGVKCESKKLFIVGRMEDESSLDAGLMQNARENPDIQFHDEVQEIEKYYAMMDVLLLPSYREGFGNIVIEAQALGVPVIVTDIPGPVDAMERDQTGIVVPVKDVGALCNAMTCLATDKDFREQLGRSGRRLVEERFDQHTLCDIILKDRENLLYS